jgi:hypothetical protein
MGVASRLKGVIDNLRAAATVRPVMVLQSDDWGRVGAPDPMAIERLREKGHPVGESAWDFYGLEDAADLHALADVLRGVTDEEGRHSCMTANFVMANPDIRRMVAEDFREFRAVAINEGFPAPWVQPPLIEEYRRLATAGVFYPGLHGYTHFSPEGMLRGWHDSGKFGNRMRALIAEDVPYLASLTPEINFALLDRSGQSERFADRATQAQWVKLGIDAFRAAFDRTPVTTCAPGYRCNDVTYEVWKEHGIRLVQTAGGRAIHRHHGLLVVERNVRFEPHLDGASAVAAALRRMAEVVECGFPAVVVTHSINYVRRHRVGVDQSLRALAEFLEGALARFPGLRFAHDGDILHAYETNDEDWLRPPTAAQVRHRGVLRPSVQ